MCTGRVDLAFVLRAFQKGADGVIVGGCWLGECHYITEGNYYALNMMHLAKSLLEYAGLDPARLRIEWISSSEGARFAEVMNDFADTLRRLGPARGDGVGKAEMQERLDTIRKLIPYIKILKKEKLATRLPREEDYDQLYTLEEIESAFSDLPSYHIDPEKCRACMICLRRCPVHGIAGGKNLIHVIDQELCIKCGTCLEACPERFGAVTLISGDAVPPPIPEEERTIDRKGQKAG
jgi:coenzyme F420-reducing hydrogenase delta subunit/Fe-S-cluster-containing hydrogenase component 2